MPGIVYQLLYKKSVDKDLRKLPISTRRQIIQKIQKLAVAPHPTNSTKLRGSTDLYRLRYTDYRIIYQIQSDALMILVVKVGHRKEVYRDFKA